MPIRRGRAISRNSLYDNSLRQLPLKLLQMTVSGGWRLDSAPEWGAGHICRMRAPPPRLELLASHWPAPFPRSSSPISTQPISFDE